MEQVDALKELRADNPKARETDLVILADALHTYCEAADSVHRYGAITKHPRTGGPFPNPYLKVRDDTGKVIARFRGLKSDRVMELLRAAFAARPTAEG